MNITIAEQHPKAVDSFTYTRAAIPSAKSIPQRVRNMAALRGLGYSYRLISEKLGISPQAVSLMLGRYQRGLGTIGEAIELQSLSCRAANALGRHGVTSRRAARERNILHLLHCEKNCGQKTIQEIEAWMNEDSAKAA